MTNEFYGKVALVTGGSTGIGKATAFAFARSGAKVIIASRRSSEGEETVHNICDQGGEALFIKTDVSKDCDVKALINKIVDKYNRLDFACNNAGIGKMGALTEQSEEDWNSIIDINLKGTWLCLKYEIHQMLKQGSGAIVNMASIGSVIGVPNGSIYAASKGGVLALTKAVALEYAKVGIRVNVVSPGSIDTPMRKNVPAEILPQILAAHPIGRGGQPEEVAEAVLWLCSDKSSFVTGHNLVVDGGYIAQ